MTPVKMKNRIHEPDWVGAVRTRAFPFPSDSAYDTLLIASENSRYFATLPVLSREMSAEIPYRWRVSTQNCVELLTGWENFRPIRSSTQIWLVSVIIMEFLRLFLRRYFAGKPKRNICCFLSENHWDFRSRTKQKVWEWSSRNAGSIVAALVLFNLLVTPTNWFAIDRKQNRTAT